MKENNLSENIIAERTLTYTNKHGKQTLIVKLGKPKIHPEADWECTFQIGEKVKTAFGADSFQALSIALQMIQHELNYLRDKQKLNLKWLEMDELGFDFCGKNSTSF